MHITLPLAQASAGRAKYQLDPSDPEYQRIRRDAASAFGDEPDATAGTMTTDSAAPDLGDQVAALMLEKRGKMPSERTEQAAPVPQSTPTPEGDLGDQVVALMLKKRAAK